MASLSTSADGLKRIRFKGADGRRKSIRLGRLPKKSAETVRSYVARLEAAQQTGSEPDVDTVTWLVRITDKLHGKLAAVGLVPKRETTTIGGLCDLFIAAHPTVKPATLVVWGQVARCLRQCFGETHQLRTIGRVEAEMFRQWLIERKLAATTISKRLQFARTFFTYATRRDMIPRNPFEGVTHKGGDPRKRQHYVTEEETLRLIDVAPIGSGGRSLRWRGSAGCGHPQKPSVCNGPASTGIAAR